MLLSRFVRPVLFVVIASGLVLASQQSAKAQRAPALGYVYPPAVVVGQKTAVQLGGYDFTKDLQWFVHDPLVKLHVLGPPGEYHLVPPPYWFGQRASLPAMPIPREVPAIIEVDASAPAGLVRWQVANANGSSGTAMFYRSRTPEVLENRSRDFAQRLEKLPVAVSGRLSRLTEVDRYKIVAEVDGPISVDLMARRLGADFSGVLQVQDAKGAVLAELSDTLGNDGSVTFFATKGNTYTIHLRDVDFRGDRAFVYRLAVTPGPKVITSLPASGQRGATTEVEFVGVGLVSGKPLLESLRQTVSFPADPAQVSLIVPVKTAWGLIEAEIQLSDVVEGVRAAGTAASRSTPQTLAANSAVTSALPMSNEEDCYAFSAAENEAFTLDLQSRAIGGSLDVALAIVGPDGKVVAESDDVVGTTDAALDFRSGVAGTYLCVVRSAALRTGLADEVYRLALHKQVAGFSLTVPQQVNVPLAGKGELSLQVVRTGGFDGEIAITAEGLPDGVSPEGDWKVPAGKNEAKVVLSCANNCAVVAAPIRLRGTALVGPSQVTVLASAVATGNLAPRTLAERSTTEVMLAMTMPALFEILVIDKERQRDVHRGTTYLAELDVVRKEGFAGELEIEMTAQQDRYRQGTKGPILHVPAGESKAYYPCFLPEWCATDLTRRIIVHGVAAVPDPKGNVRYLTKAGDARITMILEGALLKLSLDAKELSLMPGESIEIPVTIARSVKLPLPTRITLVVPEEAKEWLHAEPLLLAPGQDQGMLKITSKEESRLLGPWNLQVVATALQQEKWPVISQADLPLSFMAAKPAKEAVSQAK